MQNPPEAKFCAQCASSLVEDQAGQSWNAAGGPASSGIRVAADSPEPQSIEGERKTVTALFADIKGSTELERDLDPEDARAIVDPVLQLMIAAVHRYDGYVAQSTGDGIFALFGAPVAHEDHAQSALRAAVTIQEELRQHGERLKGQGRSPVEARIGVNSGEVVMRTIQTGGHPEYTPVGHVTNLAARMQTVAPIGGIAISEDTRRLVEGYFELRAMAPTAIKGLDAPMEVYEMLGAGPLRGHFEAAARRGLTRFVGRERELSELRRALELGMSAHGQVAAIVAEAGTGKSRLVYEFKARLPAKCKLLEAYSVSHGKTSAWLPVLELLRGYFAIQDTDDSVTRREKVQAVLGALDPALTGTLPYLLGLLGIQENPDPLAQMDPQIKKRRTLEAIKRIILRESLTQQLVVIFEDLHWIDGETQALLDLLVDSVAGARLLLLVNYRPEYRHDWSGKGHYVQLRLDPLGGESAAAMLAALLGESVELEPLKRLINERTGGNPFFIEEMVQALFDEGSLVRNGAVKVARPLSQLGLPPTVQGVLASRIDRLPAAHKDLLQTLAVIGRASPLGLIRSVMSLAEGEAERMLLNLQAGEFIYEQPTTGDSEFIFKHALTQDVAANSMLIEKRKALHEKIAQAIEALYAERLDDYIGNLAHHYARSANTWQAVKYLNLAGQQAVQRSAHQQAIDYLTAGVQLLHTLPESSERDTRELEVASALVQVLQLTRGYGAPETVEVAAHARDLAEKTGNLAQLVLQLSSIVRAAFVAGSYSRAAVLADQQIDLAQREGSPTSLWLGHFVQLLPRVLSGDPLRAAKHFEHVTKIAEAAGFRQIPRLFVSSMGHASVLAWILGYAERASGHIRRASLFAQDSKSPYDLAFARFWESWLSLRLKEPQRAEAAATQAVALSEEHGFPFVNGMAQIILGWGRAQLGGTTDGISLIRKGLAGMVESGTRVAITDWLTLLAEALALNGALTEALNTLEDALQANPEEIVFQPHILMCRGELRLKQGQAELADADFREAIGLAQKMSTKAWELCATTRLARLLSDSARRRNEARTMLAEIYGWFTEGFDTADLKDAKALLDELIA